MTTTNAEQSAELELLSQEAAALDDAATPTPSEAEPAGPSTAEVIAPIISMICDIAAPAWGISAPEKSALAEAYGALIDKYLPGGVTAFGIELNALLITAAIIAPRLRLPRHHAEPTADASAAH